MKDRRSSEELGEIGGGKKLVGIIGERADIAHLRVDSTDKIMPTKMDEVGGVFVFGGNGGIDDGEYAGGFGQRRDDARNGEERRSMRGNEGIEGGHIG